MTQLHSDRTGRAVPLLVVPAYFHPAQHPAQWAYALPPAPSAAPPPSRVLNRADGPGISPDSAHFAPFGTFA